jgi:hypothetical protein
MSATDAIGIERLEALLCGEPAQTAAEERRAARLSELRGGVLHASDALRARVLAAAPAPGRVRLAAPSRRLALIAVPAALGLAVVAAVVHGVVGSGSGSTTPRALVVPTVQQGADVGGAATGIAAPTLAPSTKVAPATPSLGGSRLRHAEATLEVRVTDGEKLSQATTKATRIAASLGGWAQSVSYTSEGRAVLDLRVPVDKVQTVVARLGALGTLVSQQLSVQDLQQQLAAESARIAQLRRRIAALEKAVANPALPDAQRVLLRIKLAEARRSLAQSLKARKGTLAAGATANVALTLSVKPKAAAVVHHHGRLGRMLRSAVGFLALEGMVALYALVVVGPLVVLAAAAGALVRSRRRREEQRLLAT